MREDQVMQAVLRFARGGSGATVVARTSALRGDLPVVGDAQVVETWNDTATKIARAYRRLGERFTVADVAGAVDVTKRQVRRVLAELREAGYLHRVEDVDGRAGVWEPAAADPGAGEVDLHDRDEAVATSDEPGQPPHSVYYTWNVQVSGVVEGGFGGDAAAEPSAFGAPPSPTAAGGFEPPS
jgi:DNA-binding transcriptional ArsR family regulator